MRLTRSLVGVRGTAIFVAACLVGACGGNNAPGSIAAGSPGAGSPGIASNAGGSGSVTVEGATGELEVCLRKSYWDPYTAETGIEVITGPEDNDDSRIRAMVEAQQFDIDVELTFSASVLPPNGPELFEPIDYAKVPKDEVIPGLALEYGVPLDAFALVMGYRSDLVGATAPTSWADYFDITKYPGKRGMFNGYYAFAWALLADGVPIDQLFPLDLERAAKKLDIIKNDLVFWETGTQALELLSSGEVVMIDITASRLAATREQGAPVLASWDSGYLLFSDFAAVVKGNPNKDRAMDLIAFVMRKDINGRQSDCNAVAPGNKEAPVNPKAAPDLATSHLTSPHVVLDEPTVAKYFADNLQKINEAWLAWKS